MRAGFRYGLVGLAAFAAGAGLWWGIGHPLPPGAAGALPGPVARFLAPQAPLTPRAPEAPAFDVAVARAATETVPVAFSYTGTVISPKDAALQPRVTGVVTERPFEPGGHVRKGQILFRIDPRPFEVALRTAEAQREQAAAQLAFADAEVERTQPLADKGYASEQRFQQLESNRQVARSRVQEAEAAIARQRLNLDYAVIRAPFDGRSGLSDVNVGDSVNENATQLVSVVQVDPIEVQVALSAEDSEAVRAALRRRGHGSPICGSARITARRKRHSSRSGRRGSRAGRDRWPQAQAPVPPQSQGFEVEQRPIREMRRPDMLNRTKDLRAAPR